MKGFSLKKCSVKNAPLMGCYYCRDGLFKGHSIGAFLPRATGALMVQNVLSKEYLP